MKALISRRKKIFGIILLIPTTSCLAILLLIFTPARQCLDFASGHAPEEAREQFIKRVFFEAIAENDKWLEQVSRESALTNLLALRSNLTDSYRIDFIDDLAGDYQYNVHFDNGLVVYLTLHSIWPQCYDLNVTEDEIFENIRLTGIFDRGQH